MTLLHSLYAQVMHFLSAYQMSALGFAPAVKLKRDGTPCSNAHSCQLCKALR